MNHKHSTAWNSLSAHANKLQGRDLSKLVQDPERCASLRVSVAGCLFDFAKQLVTDEIVDALLALAKEVDLVGVRDRMLSGEKINRSEDRAVLHTALRGGARLSGNEIPQLVSHTQARMADLTHGLRSGERRGYTGKPITDIVHIGIGGSNLGPELVVNALAHQDDGRFRIHFVTNIDAHDLTRALHGLDPQTTLFIVVSKSFGTLETQVNADSARSWFLERTGSIEGLGDHFLAVTSNIDAALEFGLKEHNLLPMWDWVGGRFSLWSAVGLPIMLALGVEGFQRLLDGARIMDNHFAEAPLRENVPILAALFGIWNYNFLGASSLAVLPYDERLTLLPDYLQQLEMESNGKSVNHSNKSVDTHTMGILWGGTGTRGQHAYHQLLHQGTRAYSADFIVTSKDPYARSNHHNWLLANAFAQSQAMALGHDDDSAPYRNHPGNHPSTTVILDDLGPTQLGALLAAYEHKVLCQGTIWDINSFDQWGVELGKVLAKPIYSILDGNARAHEPAEQDAATRGLIDEILGPERASD